MSVQKHFIISYYLCTVQQSQHIKQAMSYAVQAAVRSVSGRHLVAYPYQFHLLHHIRPNAEELRIFQCHDGQC
jgi:hypothetical protein